LTGRLEGKVALVTGATSNIGKGVAIAMAAEGASVVVAGRDPSRGAQVVNLIEAAGGRAAFVAADLDGSAARSAQLAADAAAAFGPVTVLVNNAGIYPPDGTLATHEDIFDRVFAVNVKAPFFLTAAVIPGMVEVGGGVIINLGSWIARLGIPAGAVYGATKGALETLTRTWAAEFGAQGIRVNALSPGVVHDPSDVAAEPAAAMVTTPAGKPGTPADVAAAAVYLASDEAAFVHGAVFDIDGGRGNVFTTARLRGQATDDWDGDSGDELRSQRPSSTRWTMRRRSCSLSPRVSAAHASEATSVNTSWGSRSTLVKFVRVDRASSRSVQTSSGWQA
jgi:NAD(P)-dependent dehydrogenase (short-subunit alcohol dehydrogenase family)